MAKLELRGVGKNFGATKAVHDVSLTVGDGELVCLLGPSGSGKSTVLRMIGGFATPSFGSIAIDGISLTVNSVTDQPDGATLIGLNIIPHTAAVTTLGGAAIHDQVNLEIDILARYLGRMEQLRNHIRM